MSKLTDIQVIRIPALRFEQSTGRPLYTLATDYRILTKIAAISRVRRNESSQLHGYQRPEVISHIEEIRNYLESDEAILPNSIIVAFGGEVEFEPLGQKEHRDAQFGHLVVRVDPNCNECDRPGWVVDGQQRLAALNTSMVPHFVLSVVAFVAETEEEQRDQFILVNSTKPLPRGLIHELLPLTTARLPSFLQRRKFPALLTERLNQDPTSPFFQRIKTPTNPSGVIKDNSVLRMLENSLTDGILYRFRSLANADHDIDGMLRLLWAYWLAVAEVFPDAWAKPPVRSRLTHGAGIISLGYLMDAIADRGVTRYHYSKDDFVKELEKLKPQCKWTHGFWDFGGGVIRKWNAIQNTSTDIRLLTNHLLICYRNSIAITDTQAI